MNTTKNDYRATYYAENRERINSARRAKRAELSRQRLAELCAPLPGEEWQPIPGSDNYRASSLGRICGPRGILKPQKHLLGYRIVDVAIGGRHISKTVHSLVALTFHGPRPEGLDICHNDGDKTNNAASNLRYDTREGNLADNYKNGTYLGKTRVRYPLSTQAPDPRLLRKLTVADVYEIRRLWQTGETYLSHLARQYDVDASTIRHHLFGNHPKRHTVVSNATVH